jgi:hypothetical protein
MERNLAEFAHKMFEFKKFHVLSIEKSREEVSSGLRQPVPGSVLGCRFSSAQCAEDLNSLFDALIPHSRA